MIQLVNITPTFNIGPKITVQLSRKDLQLTYLEATFVGDRKGLFELAKNAPLIIAEDSLIVEEILQEAKKHFPNSFRLVFDGAKTPFVLLHKIANDPRFKIEDRWVMCDTRNVDDDGQLIT